MAEIPVILLAAGSSSRMGHAKQLLPWGNKTIIEHQIQSLYQTGSAVFVVLGANSEQFEPYIDKTKAIIVINKEWEKGMGNSIAAGIQRLVHEIPSANAVLIALIDQPLVTLTHYRLLLEQYQAGYQLIIASQSKSGWEGVPAIFDKDYFDEMKKLNGQSGAKIIIEKYKAKVKYIECKDIIEDIDTPENYKKMHELYLRST